MSALRPCSRQGMKTGRFPWHNQRLLPRTRIQAILFEWRGFLLSKRIMSQPRTNIRKPSTALALSNHPGHCICSKAAHLNKQDSGTKPGQSWKGPTNWRSEEHTSELQSLMRISYAVFCLKKKKQNQRKRHHTLNSHKS